MGLVTTATETTTEYILNVTDETNGNRYVYKFGKDQDIQISKREAELLAQFEIDKKQPPQEILL